MDSLRAAEQNAISGTRPTFYSGVGRKLPTPVKAKGKKKGKLALIISLLMMIGGGAFLSSSNSLLAPAIEALYTDATDTQYTSYVLRTNRLTRNILQNTTTTTWTGAKKYTHMSSSFQSRLAKQNITVEGSGRSRVLKFNGETIEAGDFIRVYNDNPDFRDAFTKAKRGRVANFFDNIANRIYAKLGISRNLFERYRQTGDADADDLAFRNTMGDEFDGKTNITGFADEETQTDEEGNETTNRDTGESSQTNDSGSSVDAQAKARNFLDGLGRVQKVTQGACALLQVANAVSILVAANETYQSIQYFMGMIESISKMKAGEGEESAVNSVLNFLSTSTSTDVTDFAKVGVTEVGDGEYAATIGEDHTETGSPLEASGMQLVLGGAAASASSTTNYSLERMTNSLFGAISTAGVTFTACSSVNALISTVTAVVSLIPGVGQAFALGKALIGVGLGIAISVALSAFIPMIAQVFFTNVFEDLTGIPAGQFFTKGASAANTRVGRSGSGQSPSSQNEAEVYSRATDTVLALDAELDRKNRSPFDITNRNTFFGSIAYSLLPMITSSEVSGIASLLRSTSTSLNSLIGGVSATGEGSSYMTTYGDCPTLESIGAAGDLYCNPITTTDLSTIDLDPNSDEYANHLKDYLDCDEEGNCEVLEDKDLARYITYCANRDSPFGSYDSNIVQELRLGGTSTVGSIISTALGVIPVVGDLVDAAESIQDLNPEHQKWATGAMCVNSDDNPEWNTKMKYFQRYIEDQRILEQLGVYEGSQSPVAAYIEKYEAEHPIDNSYEGYLARISGLDKETVKDTLAFIDYQVFLAGYTPEDRVEMDGETTVTKTGEVIAAQIQTEIRADHPRFDESGSFVEDDRDSATIVAILAPQHFVYPDLRSRSYAV